MNNTYIKEFLEKIGKKFKERAPDPYSEEFIGNLKLEQDMIDMAINHFKKVKKKKEKIQNLKKSLEERKNLIKEFNSFLLDSTEKLQEFNKQKDSDKTNIYSPFNNTKPLSSFDILEYASTIAPTIHAPRGRKNEDENPPAFSWPVPWPDFEINAQKNILAYNSTQTGKVYK